MSPAAATLTRDQLAAAGYRIVDGQVVRDRRGEPILPPPPSRRAWPLTRVPCPRPTSMRRESTEQREVSRLFVACHFKVRNLSQYRKSKVALGIADLFVTGRRHAFWWETKSGERWEFSVAQLEFAEDCFNNEEGYGCGDRYAAEQFLRHFGIEKPA